MRRAARWSRGALHLGMGSTTVDLHDALGRALDRLGLPSGAWLVAVSGGPDSVVLLELVAELGPRHGIEPHVAHVDHGIHPDSASVAGLVARHADRLGLPMHVQRLSLGAGASETTARTLRYQALERMRLAAGARGIMTAHHADDQAETVLMRLVRGSGPAGLAGMTPGRGIVRPLLGVPRASLVALANARGLENWHDPANTDPVHLRNWVRLTALPTLRARLPDIDQRLLDVARQAAGQRNAWDQLLDQLPGLDLRLEPAPSLAVVPWLQDDAPLSRQLLMALGRRAACHVSHHAAARALALVRAGTSGRRAELGVGWSAELSFGRLVLVRDRLAQAPVTLEGASGSVERGGWVVTWCPGTAEVMGRADLVTWLTDGPIEVGTPEAGDRLAPLGFGGRRPLARLFQEARIARADRGSWPVVRREGDIVWVPGVCRSTAALPSPGVRCVELRATRVAAGPGPAYASAR